MLPFTIFIIQVLLFSIVPFYFATQKSGVRNTGFLIYLGIVLTLGGFFGSVYSLPISDFVSVSGGNILYAAFMAGAVLWFLLENDLSIFRTIIRLVITINVFIYFLFLVLGITLSNPTTTNLFNTSPDIFSVSSVFMIIGGVLIVVELFLFLYLFEKIKIWFKSPLFLALAFTTIFTIVICLDGVLFPILAFPFAPKLIANIIGNVGTKLVLSLPFGFFIFIFSIIFRNKLSEFANREFVLRDLFARPRESLIQEILEKSHALEIEKRNYHLLADSIGEMIFSYDPELRITFWNSACELATGVAESEALGKKVVDAVQGDLAGILVSGPNQSQPFTSGLYQVKKDGQLHYLEISTFDYVNGTSVLVRDISSLMQVQENLRATQEFYNSILENAPVSVYVLSPDNHYRLVNHKWEVERGLPREQAVGASLQALFSKELADHFISDNQKVIETRTTLLTDDETNDPDGRHQYQSVKFPLFDSDGNVEAVGGISIDVTNLKKNEDRIARLSRLYATLSQINQAIIRIRDREILFNEICRVTLKYGKFAMAWIGLLQPDFTIQPVAQSGDYGYLEQIVVSAKDEPSGRGPAGIAIREKRCVVIQNIQEDMTMQRRELAARIGYKSVAAVPLNCQRVVIGVLAVYSNAYEFITAEEVQLLEEIGLDISFALDVIEQEKQRQRAEKTVLESEEKYRTLVETSHDLIWSTDGDWRITFINRAAREIYGYEPEEMVGHLYQDFTTGEQYEKNEEINQAILATSNENFGYINTMVRKDGSIVYLSANSIVQRDEQGNIIGSSGTSRDITAMILATTDREHYSNQLKDLAQLGLAVNSTQSVDDITKKTIESARSILNCHQAVISFTTSANHAQTIQAFSLSEKYASSTNWLQTYERMSEAGIYDTICEANQVLRLSQEEMGEDKIGKMFIDIQEKLWPINGWLVAPLISRGGKNFGIIQMADKEEGDFNDNDQSILVQIAQVISSSIEKIRLIQQLSDSKEHLRALALQVILAQEIERRTISRELHDESGQSLTALKVNLQLLADDLNPTNPNLLEQFLECIQLTEETLVQIRDLAHLLRPARIDAVGLNASLEGLCIDFTKRTQLKIIYQGQVSSAESESVKLTLYRFLQEALTNIVKHAGANQVWVALSSDAEKIQLTVRDNGVGIPEDIRNDLERTTGIGLKGMQERLELLNGRLNIDSEINHGSLLTAIIPVEE